MALHELTVTELDAVCGGRKSVRVDVDVNVVKIRQNQDNKTYVSWSKDVDASNNQGVSIGSIG